MFYRLTSVKRENGQKYKACSTGHHSSSKHWKHLIWRVSQLSMQQRLRKSLTRRSRCWVILIWSKRVRLLLSCIGLLRSGWFVLMQRRIYGFFNQKLMCSSRIKMRQTIIKSMNRDPLMLIRLSSNFLKIQMKSSNKKMRPSCQILLWQAHINEMETLSRTAA